MEKRALKRSSRSGCLSLNSEAQPLRIFSSELIELTTARPYCALAADSAVDAATMNVEPLRRTNRALGVLPRKTANARQPLLFGPSAPSRSTISFTSTATRPSWPRPRARGHRPHTLPCATSSRHQRGTPSSTRMSSSSRTIESTRRCVRTSAWSAAWRLPRQRLAAMVSGSIENV